MAKEKEESIKGSSSMKEELNGVSKEPRERKMESQIGRRVRGKGSKKVGIRGSILTKEERNGAFQICMH